MLLVNGCSYTYGDELDNPEQERWSHFLGNLRSTEVVNIAKPGSSNSKIFRDTLDYIRVHCPSECVVMWSAFERVEVYNNQKADWLQVSPSRLKDGEKYITKNEKYWEQYYALLTNRETLLLNTLHQMVTLQWICEELNINLVQGWFHENCWKEYKRLIRHATSSDHPVKEEIEKLYKQLYESSKFGMGDTLSFNEFTDLNDFTRQPKGHPGAAAHKAFALYVNNVCNERGYL